MVLNEGDLDSLDGFQNLDKDIDWQSHEPEFEWTEEELAEFERDKQLDEMELEAMAAWWDMEGVRCATFGNPNKNPYRKS